MHLYEGGGGGVGMIPKRFLNITLLRMSRNQPNFFQFKFVKEEICGKLKNPIALKMWWGDRVKVEGSVENLSQNALFSNFAPKLLQPKEIFGPKHR